MGQKALRITMKKGELFHGRIMGNNRLMVLWGMMKMGKFRLMNIGLFMTTEVS